MKNCLSTALLWLSLSTTLIHAQTKNAFLERDFWKTNPSIATIEEKIATRNDVSQLNSNAFDAVVYAILEKVDNTTIHYLLTKEGNGVNKRTHDGRTYIFWAAYKDNLDLMKHLVDKGADTRIIDSHGYSVLNFAASTGQLNSELYDFLIVHGADIVQEKNLAGANALLLIAPFLEDDGLLDYFTSKGIPLDSKDTKGNGIFNYAAKGGNVAFLKLLVKKGVNHTLVNTTGGNAMLMASKGRRGHENSLKTYTYLDSLGIAAHIMDENKTTPLHAISYKVTDTKVYDFFIKKGVDINQADTDGNTPFLNAAAYNTKATVEYLSKYVDDINHTNTKGKSALTHAVARNSPKMVAFLLDKGADVSVTDTEGNSLSYYLANSYTPETAKTFDAKLALLSKKGFDITGPQDNGNTLYHIAAENNDLALFKKIENLELDINAKNEEGNTAMHIAAMKAKNDAVLKYLLAKGANKNIKTAFEETVFDLASENELLKKNTVQLNFLR